MQRQKFRNVSDRWKDDRRACNGSPSIAQGNECASAIRGRPSRSVARGFSTSPNPLARHFWKLDGFKPSSFQGHDGRAWWRCETAHCCCRIKPPRWFFFSSRRRHTRSVSAFLLNRSSDLYELNRSGLLAENEKIRPILAQLEKLLLCDLSPSTNDSVKN